MESYSEVLNSLVGLSEAARASETIISEATKKKIDTTIRKVLDAVVKETKGETENS